MLRLRHTTIIAMSLLYAIATHARPVLLISVDGLHPDYVLKADRHGLKVPNLRAFLEHGSYATGVLAVVPTVTYPNHTTMVTGAAPAEHGIVSNTTFDPLGTNRDGWYWYAEDIKVDTLWKRAAQAQIVTAAVNWPVTIGDTNIRFLLPEYWRASTADDLKLIRALARPEGLLPAMEAKLGTFVDGYIDDLESDRVRTRFAVSLLRDHKPGFMAVHLIALDGTQHAEGPFVESAYRTLEALDEMIGELTAAALAENRGTAIAIVSDHGFIPTHTAVNLRKSFVDEGLIRLNVPQPPATPTIAAWYAQVWSGGAVAAVVLRDGDSAELRTKVSTLLARLRSDPANGIARILDVEAIARDGAFPGAHFLVEFAPGFYLGTALQGELRTPATSKGTHGYLPERPEMHASFFIKGEGIATRNNLGIIDMRQIAPTLAGILGVTLPSADRPALPVGVSGGETAATRPPR